MFFYHYCDLCNIQLEDKNDYVCKTCFEVLMQECFPKPDEEESEEEEEKEERDKKKRKTTDDIQVFMDTKEYAEWLRKDAY